MEYQELPGCKGGLFGIPKAGNAKGSTGAAFPDWNLIPPPPWMWFWEGGDPVPGPRWQLLGFSGVSHWEKHRIPQAWACFPVPGVDLGWFRVVMVHFGVV